MHRKRRFLREQAIGPGSLKRVIIVKCQVKSEGLGSSNWEQISADGDIFHPGPPGQSETAGISQIPSLICLLPERSLSAHCFPFKICFFFLFFFPPLIFLFTAAPCRKSGPFYQRIKHSASETHSSRVNPIHFQDHFYLRLSAADPAGTCAHCIFQPQPSRQAGGLPVVFCRVLKARLYPLMHFLLQGLPVYVCYHFLHKEKRGNEANPRVLWKINLSLCIVWLSLLPLCNANERVHKTQRHSEQKGKQRSQAGTSSNCVYVCSPCVSPHAHPHAHTVCKSAIGGTSLSSHVNLCLCLENCVVPLLWASKCAHFPIPEAISGDARTLVFWRSCYKGGVKM